MDSKLNPDSKAASLFEHDKLIKKGEHMFLKPKRFLKGILVLLPLTLISCGGQQDSEKGSYLKDDENGSSLNLEEKVSFSLAKNLKEKFGPRVADFNDGSQIFFGDEEWFKIALDAVIENKTFKFNASRREITSNFWIDGWVLAKQLGNKHKGLLDITGTVYQGELDATFTIQSFGQDLVEKKISMKQIREENFALNTRFTPKIPVFRVLPGVGVNIPLEIKGEVGFKADALSMANDNLRAFFKPYALLFGSAGLEATALDMTKVGISLDVELINWSMSTVADANYLPEIKTIVGYVSIEENTLKGLDGALVLGAKADLFGAIDPKEHGWSPLRFLPQNLINRLHNMVKWEYHKVLWDPQEIINYAIPSGHWPLLYTRDEAPSSYDECMDNLYKPYEDLVASQHKEITRLYEEAQKERELSDDEKANFQLSYTKLSLNKSYIFDYCNTL